MVGKLTSNSRMVRELSRVVRHLRGNGGSDKSGRSCGNDVIESEQPWVSFPLNPWNLSVIGYHYEKETDIDASCYAVH